MIGLEVHCTIVPPDKTVLPQDEVLPLRRRAEYACKLLALGCTGALPRLNRTAVEFAIKMGLACHCEIERNNYFARKNYFYPDLPKGYQISQHTTPICARWAAQHLGIAAGERRILLNRIHLEEDAGKSLHDVDAANTAVDYNRAGVPLIEIVTEPDIRSGEEAVAYLTEIRKTLRYLDICDGNMEEGSMRCDANVSVRLKRGDGISGTKVEVSEPSIPSGMSAGRSNLKRTG